MPLSSIQAPLSTIERVKTDYIDGEAHVNDKLLGVLNLESIMTAEERIRTGNQNEA